MSEEKKTTATEDVKEARKLSMEELENVNGGVKYDINHLPLGNKETSLEEVSGGQTEASDLLAQYAETAKEYAVTMKKEQSIVTTSFGFHSKRS